MRPNPSPDRQTLTLRADLSQPLTVQLLDLSGKVLRSMYQGMSQPGVNQVEASLRGLPAGLYLYRIQHGDQFHYLKTLKQ